VISVDAHVQRILAAVAMLEPLELRLLDAHGCALAEDVVAPVAIPAYDTALHDGYAVRAADVAGATPATPVQLPVVADIKPGSATAAGLAPGACARVLAGAPVPSGADTVVPVEWTDRGVAHASVQHAPQRGDFVRRTGEDVPPGTTVLAQGTLLGAPQVGLLAAVGRRTVLATPRPRVVVLSVGNELVEPGAPMTAGQVPDANGYAIGAAVREAGAIPYQAGIVPDDPRRLTDTIEDHLIQADAVVISGGGSVGAYDVVREVLSRLGDVVFEQVAMAPGAAHAFGRIGPDSTPVFALPGNPVAALVAFEAFVRPALRRMVGAEHLGRPQVSAVLAAPLRSNPGERQFVRVHVAHDGQRWVATPTAAGHVLFGLATANGLAIVPDDVTDVAAGSPVTTWLLERRGV
jgi:molybdopterin molybdotransferase